MHAHDPVALLGDLGLGFGHPGDHRRAPTVADGQCERVRGVRRRRFSLQPKDSGDHRGDLSLVGPPIARHGGLDLAGGVEVHVDVALGGRERDHAAGLRGPHRGVRVLIGEHALDRDDVWQVGVHPVVDGIADREESSREWLVGRGADHVDVERDDVAATTALDHRQPAAGQPRIDTHHPHADS